MAAIGKKMIVYVRLADVPEIPLRGEIVTVTPELVRLKIGEGWIVDVRSAMILRMEEQ